MQVSLETLEGLQRTLTVEVPAEGIEAKVKSRLAELMPKLAIKGFRKGKAPLNIIEQQYGADARAEVVQDVILDSFQNALEQESIKPAGMPAFEPVQNKKGAPLIYKAQFEVFPSIELQSIEGAEVEVAVATLTEADVDEAIANIQKQEAQWETVNRPAEKGDKVIVDFTGRIDDEVFSGGTAEKSTVELGSGQMIPGFEDGIVGMSAEEEKVIEVTFPEDYRAKEFAGKAAKFTIYMHEVKAPTLPELNAEFAKKIESQGSTPEEIRETIRSRMEKTLSAKLDESKKNAIFEKWRAAHNFPVPEAMVKHELKSMVQQNFRLEENSPYLDKLMNVMAEQLSGEAKNRVMLGLLVGEYIKQHDLKVAEDELKAEVESIASAYDSPEDITKFLYQQKQQLENINLLLLEKKVAENLLKNVSVKEKTVPFKELVQ